MSDPTTLDVAFCRAHFSPIDDDFAYFDNAGGSYVPESVVDRMTAFMRESQCQPAWAFSASRLAAGRLGRAQSVVAGLLGVDRDELVIGPSTTLNVFVLAQALAADFEPGDEIVVTAQDHEANRGAWLRLADRGVVVREWPIDPETGELELERLEPLLGARTRLVCFTHVSNVVGSLNDVAAITRRAHDAGAMVCVDGVAAIAHHLPDLRSLDVDFYLFSTYKLFGPHLAVLYGKRSRIDGCRNQNHFFHDGNGPAMLNPGGLQYEVVAGLEGVGDYFDRVYEHHFDVPANDARARAVRIFDLFARHESALLGPLLDALRERSGVRVIGRDSASASDRVPTVSMVFEGRRSAAVAGALVEQGVGVAHGHFYAPRCVEALGVDPDDGMVRVSMAHYNTESDVARLVAALDSLR